jgi:hypothetical protein
MKITSDQVEMRSLNDSKNKINFQNTACYVGSEKCEREWENFELWVGMWKEFFGWFMKRDKMFLGGCPWNFQNARVINFIQ